MNQLLAIFCGNLIGAAIGPMMFQPVIWFKVERTLSLLLVLWGALHPRMRVAFWAVGMMMWMIAHNPAAWTLGSEGEIIRSNGCGFVNDDLLVASSGYVQLARGRGVDGDIVRKEATQTGFSDQILSRVQTPVASTSQLCNWSGEFRKYLLERLNHWPRGRREWLQSFVLGADMKLDQVTVGALRRLGLLHIVVLSGSHLATLSLFALVSLRFIPLIFYNFRLITMRTWPFVWTLTGFAGILFVWAFSMSVGMPQTVQRAFVLCVVTQLSELLFVKKPIGETLILVWLIQSILFPVNVFSLSMYLSWSGSLILSGLLTSHFRKSWFAILRERILIQTIFAACSLFVFGFIGFMSIGVNIIFGPVFSLLLPANFILLFGLPHAEVTSWLVAFQMMLLSVLRKIDAWQADHPWMLWSIPKTFGLVSVVLKMIQILLLLLLMVRVTSRTIKRRRDSV